MKSPLEILQPLGRALMLPIAVLPVAALLLRIGQTDLLGAPGLAAMTHGVSLSVANTFSAAGLAGVVCYVIATKGVDALMAVPPDVTAKVVEGAKDLTIAAWKAKEIGKLSIPVGILSGVISGWLYNRYSNIKLPEYLAFFGGRRFVPIVAGLAGVVLALIFGNCWSVLEAGVDGLSHLVTASGNLGLFIFGLFNRLLIVTGLHHILNNVVWFILGDFNGVTGDLNRFAAGDKTAGAFMSGFFPVMMFGLPAACLAMLHTAKPERRKAVAGMLGSLALTSFLTGVTEPIEFTFMFLAPVLYAIHAVLTGLSMALMNILDVKLGFGFSAGLFDYVLNFSKATHPLLLIPVGLVYGAIYYGVFRFAILRFNLKTPGREDEEAVAVETVTTGGGRGADFLAALGGAGNLTSVDACTTRLRLIVVDQGAVSEPALKALGARGVVRPSDKALQVVLGPIADGVAGEIRSAMGAPAPAKPVTTAKAAPSVLPSVEDDRKAEKVLSALGGPANLKSVGTCSSRLRVVVADQGAVSEPALKALGARGVVRVGDQVVHVVLGPDAERVGEAVRCQLP